MLQKSFLCTTDILRSNGFSKIGNTLQSPIQNLEVLLARDTGVKATKF